MNGWWVMSTSSGSSEVAETVAVAAVVDGGLYRGWRGSVDESSVRQIIGLELIAAWGLQR